MVRVYKVGNNVAIHQNGEIEMLIPCRSFRFEPEENFACLNDTEVSRTRNISYSDIQDENGVSIGNKQDVIAYLSPFVGFDYGGGVGLIPPNSLNMSLYQKTNQYSDFIAGTEVGQLSYAENSQGISWLPGTLGGTYFPNGWYVWNGTSWVSDRNAIANQLHEILLKNDLSEFDNLDSNYFIRLADLTSALLLKSNVGHTHSITDIVNLQNSLNLKQNLDQLVVLPSNFVRTSNLLADVTGMTVNLTAGKKYVISLHTKIQTVSTTTGVAFAFIMPTGSINVFGSLKGLISQGTANTELHSTIHTIGITGGVLGSFILTTGVGAANTPHYVGGDLYVDCITTGQLRLQFSSEVNGSSAQVNAGSILIVKTLN